MITTETHDRGGASESHRQPENGSDDGSEDAAAYGQPHPPSIVTSQSNGAFTLDTTAKAANLANVARVANVITPNVSPQVSGVLAAAAMRASAEATRIAALYKNAFSTSPNVSRAIAATVLPKTSAIAEATRIADLYKNALGLSPNVTRGIAAAALSNTSVIAEMVRIAGVQKNAFSLAPNVSRGIAAAALLNTPAIAEKARIADLYKSRLGLSTNVTRGIAAAALSNTSGIAGMARIAHLYKNALGLSPNISRVIAATMLPNTFAFTEATRFPDSKIRYARLQLSPGDSSLFALAERSTTPAAEVMDHKLPTESAYQAGDTIAMALAGVSLDFAERWDGAIFALHPNNPDASRHFCTSAREIFVDFLDTYAPDHLVFQWDPNCEKTKLGTPTRRAKLEFLIFYSDVTDVDEHDLKNVLELFSIFNSGTHGKARQFSSTSLHEIKERVETALRLLLRTVH